jgi:hypothetical protein
VGAVADLTSSVEGKVEVVWHGSSVPANVKTLAPACSVTGETVRAVVPEAGQDALVDALRRERIHIVSVTPLRTSLEEYFVQKLKPSGAAAGVRA